MMAQLLPGLPESVAWLYGGIAAVAAVLDYKRGKIYNSLTFPALAGGLVLSIGMGGWAGTKEAFAGLGLAMVLFMPLFSARVLGGGDVKLLMAMSTVLGPRGFLNLAFAALVIAGFGALAILIKRRRGKEFLTQVWLFLRSLITPGLEAHWPKLDRDSRTPFGIAIFLGFLVSQAGII